VREGSSKCGSLGEEVSNFFSLTMCPPLNWRCGGLEGVGSGKAVARTFSAGSDNLDDICVCVTRARFEREKKKVRMSGGNGNVPRKGKKCRTTYDV
jgi:hypothetical protein